MKKVILGIVIAVLLIVIAALAVVDVKYEALRTSPATSHEAVATAQDTLRVVFHPMLARDLIAAQIPEDKNVPGWALNKGLPRELAAMISPDLTAGRMAVTLFVNEQRLGPVLADQSTAANISGQIPFIAWDTKGLVHEKRGTLTMRGSAPIEQPICKAVQTRWGSVAPLTPIPIEGGHLIEAVLDNRDGAAFAVITALAAAGKGAVPIDPEQFATHLYAANSVRITADLVPPEETDTESKAVLAVQLRIEGNPRAEEKAVGTLAFMIDMMRGQAAGYVKEAYGAEITGKTERDGLMIVSNLTIKKFDRMAAKLSGAEQT